jgi:D-alanyl-D-alanine dipeptidase
VKSLAVQNKKAIFAGNMNYIIKGDLMKKLFSLFAVCVLMLCGSMTFSSCQQGEKRVTNATDDNSQFVTLTDVVPDAILEIRYYGTYNFVGARIDGYERPTALLTRQAADSLKAVSDDVKAQGFRLKIYDAYRPQKGVDHFVRWAENIPDTLMKTYFYPDLDKSVLFEQEYIYERSGHTRGSTVDLTLFDMTTEKELDMGGTFDWFGPESHPDFCGNPETGVYTGDNSKSPVGRSITEEQFKNRMILRQAMLRHGFKALDTEWWHFTLRDEPFPDTYFTFPVK